MARMAGWQVNRLAVLGLLWAVLPGWAGGIDDFKLSRAIPADSMLVCQSRSHGGQAFVEQQYERVWAAVEKQAFEKDFKRLLRGLMKSQGEDLDQFDTQWQGIADLAANVTWSNLFKREFAFAMKLGLPTGADLVMLMMPPEDEVAKDFEGLSAMLKNIAELAPPDLLLLSTEGEGESVLQRLSVANQEPRISLTLARHKDVLLLGFGLSLPEQALALLRGEADAKGGTLASTERFQQALKRLPAPTDGVFFMDLAKWMGQIRGFAQMASQMPALAETQPAEGAPSVPPLAFLPKIVDELDVWDHVVHVASTNGMKTAGEELVVLREDARQRPLCKSLYGNPALRDPLKYIPRDATGVNVSNGVDLSVLYKAALDFVAQEVPSGAEMLEMWKTQQTEMGFDVGEDLLSWLSGGYSTFQMAARGSSYTNDWAYILDVRDEAKARKTFELLCTKLNEVLASQQGGVDDANIEGAEGFKLVILPAFAAMFAGQPVLGLKDGRLFVGSGAKVISASLQAAAGEQENFSKSDRFIQEGLPLGQNVTAFAFRDLSKLGDELSQLFAIAGMAPMMLPPEVGKDPVVVTVISLANKVGRVVKTLDFFRSSCSVTTFDGKAATTKSIVNYQEPPKPKAPETQPAEPAAEPKSDQPKQ